jgi:hypothetical protein
MTKSSSVTKNITANNEFVFICALHNVTSFDGKVFKIIYDPLELTLVDFAAQTPELNLAAGIVPNTDLQILAHIPQSGILIFQVNKSIPLYQSWSGMITIIKFKAKITATTSISFVCS